MTPGSTSRPDLATPLPWSQAKVRVATKVEFILDVGELLHISLLTSFNCFLAEGFPEALSIVMVHVLFKGGDASEFDNYRGITIGPVLAKLFAMILDKRVSKWAKQHGLRAKGQVGFCKDYHTTN